MSKEGKEWKKKLLGKLRIPNPPPDRPHTGKSGAKGYDRKKEKREVREILKEEKE